MKLSKILDGVNFESNKKFEDFEIRSMSIDSRKIKPKSLFFCLNGKQFDGHNFAFQAVKAGACCLVVERFLEVDCLQVRVKDCREAMAYMASNFYKNPTTKLKIIGICGTNGKTSSTYMLKTMLEEAHFKVGVIGTIGVVVDNKKYKADMTTPDPIILHKIFRRMVLNKINYVVMEVSAHALDLKKLYGIRFEVGVLTNITQDHLDYFKTFSRYAKTKLGFIGPFYCKSAVVNLDDKLTQKLFPPR